MSSIYTHLVKLYIYWIGYSDDPLKALQNLPNIGELFAWSRTLVEFLSGVNNIDLCMLYRIYTINLCIH